MRITLRVGLAHSHKYVIRDSAGVPDIACDVREFLQGRTYDHSSHYEEWERRAKLFVKNGWAVKV